MKLTKNFRLEEMTCRDGTPVPADLIDNARAICERAQVLRDELGQVVKVTSGYRTPTYNAKVGGAKGSLHKTARALDLTSAGYTAEQLAEVYQRLIDEGKVPDGGLGVYPRPWGGWIHIDTGRPRRWRG